MTKPTGSIAELSAPEALQQCLKATRKLLDEFAQFKETDPDRETEDLEKITRIREQLIYQTFNSEWTQEQVEDNRQQLEELESLDDELRKLAQQVRDDLHQKRTANQHNRKAVNAYGSAKGQFHR